MRRSKFEYKKFTLAFYVLTVATITAFVVPIVAMVFGKTLSLMTATEWISVVVTTLAFFNASDVVDKKLNGAQDQVPENTNKDEEKGD